MPARSGDRLRVGHGAAVRNGPGKPSRMRPNGRYGEETWSMEVELNPSASQVSAA